MRVWLLISIVLLVSSAQAQQATNKLPKDEVQGRTLLAFFSSCSNIRGNIEMSRKIKHDAISLLTRSGMKESRVRKMTTDALDPDNWIDLGESPVLCDNVYAKYQANGGPD